jgi:hypothetical protein
MVSLSPDPVSLAGAFFCPCWGLVAERFYVPHRPKMREETPAVLLAGEGHAEASSRVAGAHLSGGSLKPSAS